MLNRPFHRIASIGSGFLAVMGKPVGAELGEELAAVKHFGASRIVSLLEQKEAGELGLRLEGERCIDSGLMFRSYPIPDRGVPRSVHSFQRQTKEIHDLVHSGESAVIHCRAAGIGRSGLFAAGVLLHSGHAVVDAIRVVSIGRRSRCQTLMNSSTG